MGGTGQVAELTDRQVLLAALSGLPGRNARLVVLHQHAARLRLPTPALHRYVCVKGTVRPDWICMRVVSLEHPLKGQQPLYVLNFLFLILNI